MTINKLIGFVTILLIITLALLWYVKASEIGVDKVANNLDNNTQIEVEKNKEVKDYIEVFFLDIGQGDATLIEFADGTQMLVDCAKDAIILEALGRVLPFYDKTIDYVVVTHPDLDHYGGCIDVLNTFDVGHVLFDGYYEKKNDYFNSFLIAREAENSLYTEIASLTSWDIASTTVQFLYPDHAIKNNPYIPGDKKEASSNNASIVMKLSYGDMDLLLMGDAEIELEEYLLSVYPTSTFDVEILKAGHHGSGGASSQAFVDAITPEHTIFSAGLKNSYGHPSLRVIRRVERVGSRVWRTDTSGDVQMRVFRDKIEIMESKNGELTK